MRVLVTGGAGFIGSHLADAMRTQGADLLIIDDLSSGRRGNLPDGVDFAEMSITDPEVEKRIHDFRPDAVFHLAAQIDVRKSVVDPVFDCQVNVLGTIRVARAARAAGASFFGFASTGGAIYGEQDVFPAPESHPCRPVSAYGTSKLSAEHYLEYFARGSSLRVVRLRYANVYGPRQDPHGEAGVVAIFSQKMLQKDVPTIFGDGKQTRDYVFVGDVARANLLALENASVRGAFNIGTGVETDVNELATLIARAAGYPGEIRYAPPQPGEQRRSVLDGGHAERSFGWKSEVTLVDGIARTVDFFR